VKPVRNSSTTRRVRMVLRALDRSEARFRLCEDCLRLREVYYLQARVYDSLEDVSKRDAAATRFVHVSRHLKQAELASSVDGDGTHAEALEGLNRETGLSHPMKKRAQELFV
jgi:hypothetical protein